MSENAKQGEALPNAEKWYADRLECGPEVGTIPDMLTAYASSVAAEVLRYKETNDSYQEAIRLLDRDLRAAEQERDALRKELDELQQLIDLQHTRTIRADKAWQARHGKPNVMPDLGELIDWLLQECAIAGENAAEAEDRAESAEQRLSLVEGALRRALHMKQNGAGNEYWDEWEREAEKALADQEGKSDAR